MRPWIIYIRVEGKLQCNVRTVFYPPRGRYVGGVAAGRCDPDGWLAFLG